MALTTEQAFKVGFLLKCAEDGLTLRETNERIKQTIATLEKRAIIWPLLAGLGTGAAWLGGKAIGAIPGTLSAAGTLGIAAPVVAGAGGGYLLAKGTSADKHLVGDAKQDEILGEYERLADEARRRARLKQLQQTTGRRVIALSPE